MVILPSKGREQQWNGEIVAGKWKSMAHIWKEYDIHNACTELEFHGIPERVDFIKSFNSCSAYYIYNSGLIQ